jgi:hypothetical protein
LDAVNSRWSMGTSPATSEWEGQHPAPELQSRAQPRQKLSPRLKGAYFGVLLFSIVYFARPEDLIPGATNVPIAKITGFLALSAFLLSLVGHRKFKMSRGTWLLLALFGQLCLAIPFSTWRGNSFAVVISEFSKVVVITLLLVQVVITFPRLRQLIFVQTAAVIAVCLLSFIYKTQYGGRASGVVNGIFGNPNDLSGNISFVLPFCFAFLLATRNIIKKGFWVCAIVLSGYMVVMTLSRGGCLSFLVATASSLWYMGVKAGRPRLIIVAVPLIMFFSLLITGGGNYTVRIQSIFDPAPDKAGYDSYIERRDLLVRSLELAARHPLLGIGPGQFGEYSLNWHVAHNTYTELAAEAGILASVFFIWMLVDSFMGVARISVNKDFAPEIRLFAGALSASWAGFFVNAFFSSFEYFFLPYFLMGYSTALVAISREHMRRGVSGCEHGTRAMKLEHQPCVG